MTSPDAAVRAAVRFFDGEVVDVRPLGRVGLSFPGVIMMDILRTVTAFTACADCTAGTWTQYTHLSLPKMEQINTVAKFSHQGSPTRVPLCRLCAWARWRAWQMERTWTR